MEKKRQEPNRNCLDDATENDSLRQGNLNVTHDHNPLMDPVLRIIKFRLNLFSWENINLRWF